MEPHAGCTSDFPPVSDGFTSRFRPVLVPGGTRYRPRPRCLPFCDSKLRKSLDLRLFRLHQYNMKTVNVIKKCIYMYITSYVFANSTSWKWNCSFGSKTECLIIFLNKPPFQSLCRSYNHGRLWGLFEKN